MATILKIDDGEAILEVTPPNEEGALEVWIGLEAKFETMWCVVLDRKDTENLIKFLTEHLEELS